MNSVLLGSRLSCSLYFLSHGFFKQRFGKANPQIPDYSLFVVILLQKHVLQKYILGLGILYMYMCVWTLCIGPQDIAE